MTDREQRFFRTAVCAWMVYGAVILTLTFAAPSRSLIPLYIAATRDFWTGVEHGPAQYYYLPASQIIFTPFAALGSLAGGALWRLLGIALFAAAGWRWARLLAPDRARTAFAIFLLLLIPGAAGVLRNGQFDAEMWTLVMIAAADIACGRNWGPAAALALAFAIKPQAVAALLLMGATWPRIGARAAPLAATVLALPLLCAHADFVRGIYIDLAHRLDDAVQERGPWNDINGLLASLGIAAPYRVMLVVRVTAAAASLVAALRSRGALPPPQAAFSAFALFALFLLLFNPREEGSGYVGLALICAPLAARALLLEGRVALAAALGSVCALIGLPGLTPTTLALFGIWLHPLLACLVGLTVVIPRALSANAWRVSSSSNVAD